MVLQPLRNGCRQRTVHAVSAPRWGIETCAIVKLKQNDSQQVSEQVYDHLVSCVVCLVHAWCQFWRRTQNVACYRCVSVCLCARVPVKAKRRLLLACVCVSVCLSACECVCARVCMCVGVGERVGKREYLRVCVYECVREREYG